MVELPEYFAPLAALGAVLTLAKDYVQLLFALAPIRDRSSDTRRPPTETCRLVNVDLSAQRDCSWQRLFLVSTLFYCIALCIPMIVLSILVYSSSLDLLQDWANTLAFCIMVVFPAAMILLNVRDDWRYKRSILTRSSRHLEVQLEGDKQQVFEHIRRTLADMGATTLLIDHLRATIEVRVRNSWIRVDLAADNAHHLTAYITIDGYLPSTGFDSGTHAKRLDELIRRL
ncbi:MAG: hypothetical protein GX600_11585 [Dehalococcoidia bacterium]|nr:hypothetical protein [Dehalococcoidia bacterium]